jgi:hypothetical protein
MNRCLVLTHLTLCLLLVGCGFRAPAQYDHAMLRGFFGKSPEEVEATFGKPSSIGHTDSALPPPGATKDQQEQFNRVTKSMQYGYATVDGDLVFHFNLNNRVSAITYRGVEVSPPRAPIPGRPARKGSRPEGAESRTE